MTDDALSVAARMARTAAVLADSGKYDAALATVNDALRADPTQFDAWCTGAVCRLELNEPEEARAMIDEALRLRPGDAWANRVSALVHLREWELVSALDAIQRSLIVNPQDPASLATLAEVLAAKRDFHRARQAAQASVALAPNRPASYSTVGVVELQAGSFRAARAAFLQELKINPNSWTAHHNLGVVSTKRGNDMNAMLHFARSIRIYPRQRPISQLQQAAHRSQMAALSGAMFVQAVVGRIVAARALAWWWLLVVPVVAASVATVVWRRLPAEVRTAMSIHRLQAVGAAAVPGLVLKVVVNSKSNKVRRTGDVVAAGLTVVLGVATLVVPLLPRHIAEAWMTGAIYAVGIPVVMYLVGTGIFRFEHGPKERPHPSTAPARSFRRR